VIPVATLTTSAQKYFGKPVSFKSVLASSSKDLFFLFATPFCCGVFGCCKTMFNSKLFTKNFKSFILKLSSMIRFNGRNTTIFLILNNFCKSLKSMIDIIIGSNKKSPGKMGIVSHLPLQDYSNYHLCS